jgi:hypothetical protein
VVACADGTGALASLPIDTGMDRTTRRRAQRAARRQLTRLARLNTRLQRLRERHGDDQGKAEPYRPPEWMVRFVKARDGACRFPGCTVAARFCDLDHVRPWPAGPTHPENLVCLCRRHHRVKQRRGWHPLLLPDGSMVWTDPTGATRTTTPVDHLHLHTQDESLTPAPKPAPAEAVEPPAPPTRRDEDVAAAVAAELPSVLEEELEHRHDHHLIALACRPANLTWHTRHALRTGTRVNTTRTAAQLQATTRAGIQLIHPRRPMLLDLDNPHQGHRQKGPHPATARAEDDPPF